MFTENSEAFELDRLEAYLGAFLPALAPAINCDPPVTGEASRKLTSYNGCCGTNIWPYNVPGLSNNGDPSAPALYAIVNPYHSMIRHAIDLLSSHFP
jgi:hypothetical protein